MSKPTAVSSICDVVFSCSGTAVSASSAVIRPGERGEITAIFTLGERIGRQEKLVTVTTADASPPATLAVRVEIREIVAATPQILRWRLGEYYPVKSPEKIRPFS